MTNTVHENSDMLKSSDSYDIRIVIPNPWYVYKMVAQNMLRTMCFQKKIWFDNSFDVTKCLQPIKTSELLHMYAPWSELPSNTSTMVYLMVCRVSKLFDNTRLWFERDRQPHNWIIRVVRPRGQKKNKVAQFGACKRKGP